MTLLAAEPLSDAAALLRGAVELSDEIRAASGDAGRGQAAAKPGDGDAEIRRILAASLHVLETRSGKAAPFNPSGRDIGQLYDFIRREARDRLEEDAAGAFLLAVALELEPAERRREERSVARALGTSLRQ